MKWHRFLITGFAAAVLLALFVPIQAAVGAQQSALTIKSQSAIYKRHTGMVAFRIVFNRPPDFRAADEFNRQADSFQYFVGSTLPQEPQIFDSIIGGEEIHSAGLIPIRNAFPPDPQAASGGWGTIRAEGPFTLHGCVLKFSAPLRSLTDRTNLSVLPYQLEAYEFGAWNGVTIIDYIRLKR
jgi:hypothetical protein